MKSLRSENRSIDTTDIRLLCALSTDARRSIAELARLVGLSAPSVAERIKRLEEAGVIEGYAARIDPKALGLPIAAWLRIRPVPGQLYKVAEILNDIPEIVECDRITGEDCFIARAWGTLAGGSGAADRPDHALCDDQYFDHSVLTGPASSAAARTGKRRPLLSVALDNADRSRPSSA